MKHSQQIFFFIYHAKDPHPTLPSRAVQGGLLALVLAPHRRPGGRRARTSSAATAAGSRTRCACASPAARGHRTWRPGPAVPAPRWRPGARNDTGAGPSASTPRCSPAASGHACGEKREREEEEEEERRGSVEKERMCSRRKGQGRGKMTVGNKNGYVSF